MRRLEDDRILDKKAVHTSQATRLRSAPMEFRHASDASGVRRRGHGSVSGSIQGRLLMLGLLLIVPVYLPSLRTIHPSHSRPAFAASR